MKKIYYFILIKYFDLKWNIFWRIQNYKSKRGN